MAALSMRLPAVGKQCRRYGKYCSRESAAVSIKLVAARSRHRPRACSARAEIGRILTAFWIGDSTGIDSPLGGGRCRLPILLIFEVG